MTETMQFDLDDEEKEVFCQEAEELIGRLDTDLLAIERNQNSPDVVQDLFRAAHTLKGSSGSIGHTRMANLTHAMETVLELLRQDRLTVTPEFTDMMLETVDVLRGLLLEVSTGQSSDIEPDDLVRRLQGIASGDFQAEPSTPHVPSVSGPVAITGAVEVSSAGSLQITANIASDSIAPAARAMQVLLALDECGKVLWSKPSRAVIEQEGRVLKLEVMVETSWTPEKVRQHLAFIGELSSLDVAAVAEKGPETADSEGGKSGTAPSARLNGTSNNSVKTVRTSVERLDKLMNLVGELVTDRNRLLQAHTVISARYADGEFIGELAEAISHLANITDELQEEVMRARMLPLEHAFSKFPRIVRDLARDAGKNIVLEIEGQETELDRSVIEEIGDPLLHLLRNSVDHGIETPDERRAAGKPEQGTIRLSGRSEGNHIIITISDDGHGIDADSVRRAAVKRGQITEEVAAHLSETEAMDLIFTPGLSTARKITDISGRGVGMDVVRNNIERLHGSVSLKSQRGQGTVFELSLPLTLAIMHVLLVDLAGYTYCIPLTAVTEVLAIDPQTIHAVDRGEVILWRERLLPLLRLRQFFGLSGAESPTGPTLPTVAVRWGEEHLGLVVDRLLGQQEIVIKSLGVMIGQVPGLSGSTILGDGSVALIADVPGLIKRATRMGAELSARAQQ